MQQACMLTNSECVNLNRAAKVVVTPTTDLELASEFIQSSATQRQRGIAMMSWSNNT